MRVFTFLLVLILSGCATTELPPVPETERLKSEALVLGQLISNTSAVGDLVKSFGTIELENIKTKKKFDLNKSHNKYFAASNASVSGWLPEGDYRVIGLFGYGIHPLTASFNAKKLGVEFSVKAGQVYDINTLIFQPLGGGNATIVFAPSNPENYLKIGAMGNAYPVLAERKINEVIFENTFPLKTGKNSANAGGAGLIVNAFISAGASKMHGEEKNQWNNLNSSAELISLTKKSTTVLNDKIMMPDGSTIFGSTLGQILVRNTDGSWINYDTGVYSEITSLLKHDQGIIAATDNGEFLFSDGALKTWKKVGTELPYGAVVRMFKVANERTLLVIKAGTGLEVRTAENMFSVISQPIHKIDVEGNAFWQFEYNKGSQLAATMGDKIIFLKSAESLVVYDIAKNSWSERKLDHGVAALEEDSQSQTVTFHHGSGAFGTTKITTDAGANFIEVKHKMSSRVRFTSPQIGYALQTDMGFTTSSNHFAMTTDGGKKWVEGKELPEACTDWDLIDKRMICITRSGAILSTLNAKDITVERLVN